MPIDPSIAMGFKQPEMPDGLNSLAKFMQVQHLQQQGQLGQMQMDQTRRTLEESNTLNDAYKGAMKPDGTTDRNMLFSSLAQRGLGSKLPGIQKAYADQDESETKAKSASFDLRKKEADQAITDIAGFTDAPSALADIERKVAGGKVDRAKADAIIATMPKDPAQFPAWQLSMLRNIMSAKDRLTHDLDVTKHAETGRHNRATEGNASAVLAENRRHHGATEGQARATAAATMSKPFEVTGEDGLPVLVQQDKQGNLKRVEGFSPKAGANGAGTGDERNAAGYASRMGAAEKLIADAIGKDPKAQKPGLVEALSSGSGMDMVANGARSATRQEYRQAQEDWVRAKLRKESGAAIPNDEMEREISVYFPQINDKPGVIAQKAAARKVAEKAMQQSAGRAFKSPTVGAGGADNLGDDPLGLRNAH